MKCLIINGSPSTSYRMAGKITPAFTAQLVEAVKENMASVACESGGDVEFTEIRLADAGLPFCRGCYNCFNNGEQTCPFFPQMKPLMDAFSTADCLILSSPVYVMNVSALVKNFFDLASFNAHRPRFFNKTALVVSSTAGGGVKSTTRYMRDILECWGFNHVRQLAVTRMGVLELTEKMCRKCRRVAIKLYRDAAEKKLYAPSLNQVLFFQFWKNFSQASTATEADRSYWKSSGLCKRVYAPGTPVGPAKRIFAGIVSAVLKRVFGSPTVSRIE
jgi:multimeric flavodoxin WrbA